MKISVIIPTFNRIDLLKRAIDSVLNQSINPYDNIVVDDGSTDETVSEIKKITVIRNGRKKICIYTCRSFLFEALL